MIHQINLDGKDKVQVAIDRFKAFEPEEGYFLAFSGGKDSVVIKALADMAGVKYDAHYSITTVDPPVLVKFIKTFPDVQMDSSYDNDGKRITMWNLIPNKLMPPTRLVRYCCEKLKESSGQGRITVTGVRWDESSNRKNNQGLITFPRKSKKTLMELEGFGANFTKTDRGGVVLNDDNDASRRSVEYCYRTRKTILNPIVDWTTEEVWEFIREYKIPYCQLYDEGYERLGCIGCPMSGTMEEEFEKYPIYRQNYIKAFERMIQEREKRGLTQPWKTGEEVMEWWLSK